MLTKNEKTTVHYTAKFDNIYIDRYSNNFDRIFINAKATADRAFSSISIDVKDIANLIQALYEINNAHEIEYAIKEIKSVTKGITDE